VSTTEKGDKLEDALFAYLCEQKCQGSFVFGAFPPRLCNIYRKKKYHCSERDDYVEFDIVIEVVREGQNQPYLYVVFECKNYDGAIPERDVTDFSDKLSRLFRHAAKGIVVVSTRLQSGAEKIARNRKLGIVKFDQNGMETIANRKGAIYLENNFVRSQIFEDERRLKPLKFAAYCDGAFYGSVSELMLKLDPDQSIDEFRDWVDVVSIPFVSIEEIGRRCDTLLEKVGYQDGSVDLAKICSLLSVDLQFSGQELLDVYGNPILGSANFDKKLVQINHHNNKNRERFTLAHEIGHFYLDHDAFLRSETFVENDMFIEAEFKEIFNYERLEYQANIFASHLILPERTFMPMLLACWYRHGFKHRGHGFIFVDDQPCNFAPYISLVSELSEAFEVSIQAVEVRLKKMGLLTDRRKNFRCLW
jgi:Zn-dependent peptidase ImmA (M78 family)